ncbi:unnamed protein product, partial [marine sediment metagenome]
GIWFFGNPVQIGLEFVYTKVTAYELLKNPDGVTEAEANALKNMKLDSETLEIIRSSNLLQGMYADRRLSLKAWLLIIGGVILLFIIFTLAILHFTGVIDIT